MAQRFEGQFDGHDQTELFFQTWTPENVRGTFILTHGLAEHSECYHPLAKALADDGWLVYAWDMRGHGRSEGKRGYVRSLSQFIDDLEVFHKLVRTKHPQLNTVFFGHSLGGLITTRYLETRRPEYSALCLSSPAAGLSVAVPKLKEKLAHIANRWMPTLTMYNEIKYEDLTRDESMIKSYRADTLRHDKISPGLFLGMVEHFPLLLEQATEIKSPVLMQLSGEDRLVSTQAARELFERFPNKKKELVLYAESYHEVFNDLDRDKAMADLKKFVNPYLGA
ncbi:MAG: lysophospholipase [Bdellovibrionales bacterium]|nr:lysophospholipase [Bdellovibrionales bacterium]